LPPSSAPPFAAYREIVAQHLKDFTASSHYIQDRVANLKTMLPALKKNKVIFNPYATRFIASNYHDIPPSQRIPDIFFLAPWMNEDTLGAMLDGMDALLKRSQPGKAKISLRGRYREGHGFWNFSEVLDPLGTNSELGRPIALFNGTLGFSGAQVGALSASLPNLAKNDEAYVRKLSDNPVLALNNVRPLWSVAADRLDGTRHLDITEQVRASIAERIFNISQGAYAPRMEQIESQAFLRPVPGKKKSEAWLKLKVSEQELLFRFADGGLYRPGDTPDRLY
jgi:hypothetical protein